MPTEAWDDGNTNDADGCNSDCTTVEEDWIWSGGSITSKDTCTECPNGYTSSETESKWVKKEPDDTVKYLNSLATITIAIGLTLSLLNALLSGGSPQTSFSMFNSIQLILLLPLIGTYMPFDVLSFIIGMDFSMFSINIFDIHLEDFIPKWTYLLDFEQKDLYLSLIGLESGSSILNVFDIFQSFIFVPIIHALVVICYFISKSAWKSKKWLNSIMLKIFRQMTFGVYIIYFYEVFIYLCLIATSEIKSSHPRSDIRFFSLSFAVWLSALLVLFGILALYQWFISNRQGDIESMLYFAEFFASVKSSKKSRFYALMFILRRSILWSIVILFSGAYSLFGKTVFFTGIQLIYLSYILIERPFKDKKDNIWEIINELIYSVLWGSLLFLKDEQAWTDYYEKIYVGLMLANNLFFTLISFGKLIFLNMN